MNAMISDLETRAGLLLKEMGIDVWRARRMGDETGSAAQAAPTPARSRQASRAAAVAREASPPTENPAVQRHAIARQNAAVQQPEIAPFNVLCLSNPGAVLLVESGDVRSARRFAADLLAAVTGVWGGEMHQLVFEWPQPGIAPSSDAIARALGAFVNKQLADNAGALVMVGREVADRLSAAALPEHCLVLPSFDALMTDGSLKRALWQDLASRRS